MTEVTWNLPDGVAVIYSSLMIPDCERDDLNREVAAFRVGGSLHLDVEWDTTESQYVITLFKDDIESPKIPEIVLRGAQNVKETVENLARQYAPKSQNTPA
jgi:hypothetical protein